LTTLQRSGRGRKRGKERNLGEEYFRNGKPRREVREEMFKRRQEGFGVKLGKRK